MSEHVALGADDVDLLREVCEGDDLHFEMTRSLIAVERKYRTMSRRNGLFDALEAEIKKGFYDGVDDAMDRAKQMATVRDLRKGRSTVDGVRAADMDAMMASSNEEAGSDDAVS